MKIAIDARHLRDFGVGTYLRNLIEALGQIDCAGEQFTLICAPGDQQYLKHLPPNFEVVSYDGNDRAWTDHFRFPAFLRKLKADLVHIPLNRVPLLMPKPYVVTVHDLARLLYNRAPGWRRILRMFRTRRGLSRSHKVITVSGATLRELRDKVGIPDEHINLIYNAPDPHFSDGHRAADARGQLSQERERQRILERYQIQYPFLLYAGTIRPHKNIPRLVEAFAVISEELREHPVYKDLRLLIIGGEISKYPEVRHAVMQSRIEKRVRFLGFVPFDTLRFFYVLAQGFVFPTLYEGFGLPPLEAMVSGTPVLCSNLSSLPEVVGDAAVLVNPENVFDIARGMRELLLDEDLRAQLRIKGRERAAQFSWKRTAAKVLEVYREAGK